MGGDEIDRSITDRVQVLVGGGVTTLGGVKHRRLLLGKKVQKGEHLPAKLKGIRRENAQLGHGIQEHALWLEQFYLPDDLL